MKRTILDLIEQAGFHAGVYAGARVGIFASGKYIEGIIKKGVQVVAELGLVTFGVSVPTMIDGEEIRGLQFSSAEDGFEWTVVFDNEGAQNIVGSLQILEPGISIESKWLDGVLSNAKLPRAAELIGTKIVFTTNEEEEDLDDPTDHVIQDARVIGYILEEKKRNLLLSISVDSDECGTRIAGIFFDGKNWKLRYVGDYDDVFGVLEVLPSDKQPVEAPEEVPAPVVSPELPEPILEEPAITEAALEDAAQVMADSGPVGESISVPIPMPAPGAPVEETVAAPAPIPIPIPEPVVVEVPVMVTPNPPEVKTPHAIYIGGRTRFELVPERVIFLIKQGFGEKHYRKLGNGKAEPVESDKTGGWKPTLSSYDEIDPKQMVEIVEIP